MDTSRCHTRLSYQFPLRAPLPAYSSLGRAGTENTHTRTYLKQSGPFHYSSSAQSSELGLALLFWCPAQGRGARQAATGPRPAPVPSADSRSARGHVPSSRVSRAAGRPARRAAQPRLALLTLCWSKAILSSKTLTGSEESGQCWLIARLIRRGKKPQNSLGLRQRAAAAAVQGRDAPGAQCPAPYLLPRLATRPGKGRQLPTARLRQGTSHGPDRLPNTRPPSLSASLSLSPPPLSPLPLPASHSWQSHGHHTQPLPRSPAVCLCLTGF